jgi:formylglycine-generating enzyme required for sulfatase activity
VEKVNWYDAIEFCARLSKLTGREYRLPSEAEWEYACRAGTTTAFHFGETITTDLANYRGTDWEIEKKVYPGNYGRGPKGIYREETTPVGYFKVANDFGLYDMHGNVWEWCADDWHDNYDGAPTNGSAWLDSNQEKKVKSKNKSYSDKNDDNQPNTILRGGSWYIYPTYCRSAYRPDNFRRFGAVSGFRVVCGARRTWPSISTAPEPVRQSEGNRSSTPEPSPETGLKVFNFEIVEVNAKGEQIKKESKQSQYFSQDLGNDITLEMVAIPGGTFTMGTEDEEIERLVKKFDWEGFRRERPQHQVTVPPFFMGKYPITQAQWQAIASRADLKVKQDLEPKPAYFKDRPDSDRRPVEKVNWYDAIEFCARLSKLTGREYRLPSEAEWEYACRAGTTTPFYFGETITGKLANYNASNTYADEPNGEYRKETTPVGQFPPNAFGLYDMHGNVWEWCADTWHDNYDGAPRDGSVWTKNENDNRSPLRGGSWYLSPNVYRSAFRLNFDRRAVINDVSGFRVVCGARRTL